MHKKYLVLLLISTLLLLCACTTTPIVSQENSSNQTTLQQTEQQIPLEQIPPAVDEETLVDLNTSTYNNSITKISFEYPSNFKYTYAQDLVAGGKGHKVVLFDFNATNISARLYVYTSSQPYDGTLDELDDIEFKELTVSLEAKLDAYSDAPQIVPVATHTITAQTVTYVFRAKSPLAIKVDEKLSLYGVIYLFSENLTTQEHKLIWESLHVE